MRPNCIKCNRIDWSAEFRNGSAFWVCKCGHAEPSLTPRQASWQVYIDDCLRSGFGALRRGFDDYAAQYFRLAQYSLTHLLAEMEVTPDVVATAAPPQS